MKTHAPHAKNAHRRPSAAPLALALSAILATALALPSPATAQARKDKPFEDRANVVEVQIPVNVTARDGQPVRGLTAEDFTVLDRGDRQEITHFEVIDLDELSVTPEASAAAIDRILPSSARRHFLLLFDLSFSSPSAILKARDAAREFLLDSLHPTDLAAVAIFSLEAGPRLIVTFTPDRAQLARAIDAVGSPRQLFLELGFLGSADPLRFILPEISTPNDPGSSRGFNQGGVTNFAREADRIVGKQMSKQEKSFSRGKVSIWASYLSELAQMLASVEGRKQVVYFSEGFDGRLMLGRQPVGGDIEEIQDQQELAFGNFWMVDMADIYGDTTLQGEVGDMLSIFRRSDCVIQAVDISGLRAATDAAGRSRRVDQDVLFYLANDTGGELFEDTNNLGQQLDRVLRRSTVTYVLTFRPEGIEADGDYHRIKVKADLPRGTRLSHREGYYAPRPYQDLHPLEKSLLASDAIASAAPKNDLAIDVLAAPFRAGEGKAYVPVIIEIPGEGLLDGQPEKEDQLAVELYGYATDEKGEMKDFFSQVVGLDLGNRELEKVLRETGLKYYGHLELEEGRHLARILVRNAVTGRTGVVSKEIVIPPFDQAEAPVLLPPFFPEPPGSWLLVRERQDETAGQRTVIYPFTAQGEPYVPAAKPSIAPGSEALLYLVAYNLSGGEIKLDAAVRTDDGRDLAGGEIALVERTITGISGLDKLHATFRPTGLERGDYTLEVALIDQATGLKQVNSVPFTVLK